MSRSGRNQKGSQSTIWDADTVKTLLELVDARLSATQIANALTSKHRIPFSRNAVIGKLKRLGISLKSGFTSFRQHGRPEPHSKKTRPTVSLVRTSGVREPADYVTSALAPTEQYMEERETATEAPAYHPDPTQPVPLLDLRACMCRWPIGDPMDPGFGFCGKRTASVVDSYCAHHRMIAYRPESAEERRASREAAMAERRRRMASGEPTGFFWGNVK